MKSRIAPISLLSLLSLLALPALGQLSGNYTINPNGSGTTNFKTFTAAVNQLNSVGVSGAVVFNVANGTYTEQITLNYVSGSSATNTITFQGKDSSKVLLNYNCSQYESVVKVNAAAYFGFKEMTIQSTNNTYGYGIHITAGAHHISVLNCVVEVASRSGVGADCIPISISGTVYNSAGDNGEDVTVRNCILEGGYFGTIIYGTNNSLLSKNFTFDNVLFTGQYVYGLYAVYASNIRLNNCRFQDPILYYAYGIYTNQCAGGAITNSKLYMGRFGMYLYLHNYYNRSDSLMIVNNEISDFADASYQAGILASACYNLRVYHNAVHTNGTVSDFAYSCMYFSEPSNHIVVNNNLKASGNNNVFYLGAGSLGNTLIDNNNYHAGTNGNLISWQGTTYNNLAQLKSAVSGQNQNSTNDNPGFAGKRNLVPKTPGLNNRARKGYASTDLAGNGRPKAPDTKPDIGAYEYYVAPVDMDIEGIPYPVTASIGNNFLGISLKNNGSQTFNDTIFVKYQIDNGSWVSDTAVISNLTIGSSTTLYFSKAWAVSASGSFSVCVEISPGLSGDPDSASVDKFCATKCVGRTGTFVIDPSGSGDYKTFKAAVSSLDCGIAGPIKFEVKPGVYKERIEIKEVLGSSATNTITFEGTDRDQVVLQYTGTSSLPSVVLMNDADYIIFKNISLKNDGNQVANGFWLRENCHDVRIENCAIYLDSVTANYATTGILVANSVSSSASTIPGNTSYGLSFKNNIIVGGSHGIRISGAGTNTPSANILVKGNTVRKYYYVGLDIAYLTESKLANNRVSSPRDYTAFGLAAYYCSKDTFDANYIEGGRYGIYLYLENYYYQNSFSLLSNNMITNMLDPNYQIGIYAYAGYNVNIFHNSVYTTNSYSNPYYATCNLYYCNNSQAKNNAFLSGEGVCFSKYYGNISAGAIDHNNYQASGAAKYYHDGLTFTDVATWKTVKTQFNQSSKEGDPNFNAIDDLHASGAQLNNAGVKSININWDFDGQARPFAPDKKVDIGADEYYVSPYDLDLIALDSPIVPLIGSNEVRTVLKNAGIKSLINDTAVLSYHIDGTLAVRDTIVIVSLLPGQTYLHTFSKPWTISVGKTYQLCAQLDTFYKPDPDSLTKQRKCKSMCPGAKGTYVIDKKGNGDFKSFRGALRSLGCGVSGPVTFLVKNGTYNERVSISEITGASSINTISFIGESQGNVRIHYTGRADSMSVIRLRGADHISFKNIIVKNFSNTYGRCARLSEQADYNTFTNCQFQLPLDALNGYCIPVYISDDGLPTVGNAGNNNLFENCLMRGGYYCARLDGIGASSLIYNNAFVGCQFYQGRVYGIYAIYQGGLRIEQCQFDSLRLEYYQLFIYLSSQTNLVSNVIKSGMEGVYMLYENYYFEEESSTIANNLISDQMTSSDNYGLDIYYSYNIKVLHNSLNMNKGNSGSVVRFRYGNGYDFRNNSLAKSTSADLFNSLTASFTALDFNNYYKGTSNNFVVYNGTTYGSLSSWKSGMNGINRDSKEGDPGYRSATDLTIAPTSKQLSNWGAATTGITTDYEGDIRNPLTPDVGADEYSDLYDLGVSAILSPSTGCERTSVEQVQILVKNLGNKTVPTGELIPVSYIIGSGTEVNDTFILSSALLSNATIAFTFATRANLTAYTAYQLKTWTDLPNDSTRNNDTAYATIHSYEFPQAAFSVSGACTGEDITFTDGSTITSSTISNWKWTFGNGKTSTLTNPKTQYSTSGVYSVKLVVTAASGCKDSTTTSITLNTKPLASLTVSKLCHGDSTTFTNTSSIATATGASFLWDFDNGSTSTRRHPKHTFAITGTYDVVLVSTSSEGCADTATSAVVISAQPTASFSSVFTCKGDSTHFTNTSTIPLGFTPSYAWSFGDGNTSTSTNPAYLYGAIGNYTVMLTASLTNGCSSQATRPQGVFSKPQPAFATANVCLGDSAVFTNSSVIQLDTIDTYTWTFGDGNGSSQAQPKYLYATSGTFQVKLVIESVKGCRDSLGKTVEVYDKPATSISVSTVCEGVVTTFDHSTSIASGSLTAYAWVFGDGFTSSAQSPTHLYDTANTYPVSFVVYSNNGCTDTALANAVVNVNPEVDFDVSNVCFGSTLYPVNNSSIKSGSISSYSWHFGDGNTSSAQHPFHKYLTKDTFDVRLIATSNLGCKDSMTIPVIVDSKLAPNYIVTEKCLGDSTLFQNTTNISCGSVTSYYWDFGDGNNSARENPRHKYASAGTYNVKLVVYQQGGVKDSITKQVVAHPYPSSNFTASNTCAGKQMSFTNNSSIGSGSISSYQWDFGDGNKSSQSAPSHTYATHGAYDVRLVSTSNFGCKDTLTKRLDIYELPKSSFSVSNACLGSSVSFSNNSSISSGSLSYAWSFGDGFSSTQTSPNYTYASAGTYTVTLTATSGSGCSSISSKQVTIHPRPVPGFSAANQCANVAISFNNSSTISSGTLSYLWRFGDKTNSTAVNPNHLYASPGSYSVTLVATSNKGCVDSAKKSVSALPTPIANFTVPSACGGTTVNYANGSSVPSGSMTHLWYFGDGKTSTLTSPTHIYSSTGTYTVKLVSTASSGCKDSVEKTVKVYDLPTASFTVSGKCLNDSILFTNNSSIASGLLTYKWSLGDGSTSTRKQISHLYSAIGTYPVKLVAYSSGGCNDSSTQSVSVYYSPSAAFSAPDACLGQGITFSNTSSIPSGSLSYLWDFDNGSASTLASPTHTYATTGSYDVLLIATSNNGCEERLTKTVEVHPNPVAGFTHAKTCLGDTTVFLNSSTIASGTLSYLWDFGDGNKTSSNNPSNTYSATGTYNISLTATSAQGCSDTESKKLYINPVSNTRFVADNTCEGQPMAFDNKTTLSSGSYVSTWKLGDGNTSVATDPIHRYINPGSYTVVLTTTTDSGCVSKYKVVRVVHHKPTAGFTSANTCLADSASFVDQSSVAAGKVMGHIWQFGDGFGHNTMNPKHLYQNFGTYLISQIVRTDSGCTDTATMNIQVYPMPQAGFTAGNVCFGDTLYPLNTSSIATGSIGGYAWDFGDGNSSTATSPFHYYMAKGKYDISLVATSDKGCRDTATTSITVDNVVVPGFTFSNVCVGSQVSFTNTTNASCGKVSSYQWSFGDGNISSQLSPSHLYTKAGSYNVQLVVTEKSGRKDTLIKTVVIYPNPQVAFAAHDTCAQSAVRVKNKSTITSGSIGNYTWHMGDGNKYSGLVPSHAYTSPGPYTIKLVATSNHGCTDSLEYTGLDIHYLPQVKFSYIADCEYNSVQFTNGSAITAGTLAYAWDLGDMTTSTSKAPTHSYPAGNYTVRLTATSNLGCVATISRGLWVSPAPIAKALADSVCQGLENQFTNLTSLASGSIASYDWAFGDGFTATQAQPTHTYNIAGFYKATLITVSDSGCRDTAYTSAGVWPRPTIDFDVSNICLGDDFTPTNRSAISTGSITGWKWDFGDGNQSTVKSPTHTYLAKGSYAVKLVATSDKSCADSSSKSILVDNVIRAGFAVSNVCLGDTARFTNTSSTSCGTVTGYVWDFGDGGTSTGQHPTYKYKTAGTYTVRLIVLQQGGNRDTFEQGLVVYPKPVTGFSATDGCQGTAVSFTNNSSISGGGPMNYVWSMGNGYKTTSSSPIYTYGAPATYRVVLQATSDKGCVDSTTKNLAQYAMPVAAFVADTVCEGTAVTFTNSTTIASGTISYLWSFGDGFSSTQTSPSYLYAQAGNYSVQLKATSDKGCADLAVHAIRVLDMPNASYAIYDTCATSQLRVNNLSTISSGSMTHFWDLGDGTKQIGAKPKHGYAAPGTYWVKLVSISDKGCADSSTLLATIFENPIAAIGYTASCPDQAVSFTHKSTPSGSIATVLWDFGLGNTSTANNPSHTYGNSGTATGWLKVSTSNNCWDTAKKVIQFESVPVASFSWPSISCQRDSVVFTNQTTLKQGTATYLWRFGSELTSTDMQGKYAFDSAGAYDVTLVATSNAGCMDSLTQTITLLDKPEPAFEFTGGCLGDTTYFEATSGPGALKGAKWRLGDGNTNNSLLGTKHLYASTGIYEVVYTTWNDNCADSAAKTIDLAVGPKNLDFEFANSCAREKVQFINLTSNGNLSYKWLFFDGSSSNLREPVKYYGKAGKFPIGFIAWEGDCVDSAYKVIEIYPYPDSSFGFIQQAGAKFRFIPKHLGDASYYWDFGDGNTSVLQEPRHTYSSNGTYLVKLTVLSENFCASVHERSVSVNVYTSLGQTAGAENMISLYPNPFDRAVRAALVMAQEGRVRMTVFNELGQQVGTAWEGNLLAGTHDIPLIDNAETLRAGMYFVQVEMGNQSSMLKLILAR